MLWALALDLRNLVAPKSMIPLTNKCTMAHPKITIRIYSES